MAKQMGNSSLSKRYIQVAKYSKMKRRLSRETGGKVTDKVAKKREG
jgi:hypothetical protein